jgi:hypothetical protein
MREKNRLINLKDNIGMMGYVNTERTGVMDPAILMMVKDRDKDSETDCNQ